MTFDFLAVKSEFDKPPKNLSEATLACRNNKDQPM